MWPGEIECPEGDATARFGDFGLLIRLVDRESDCNWIKKKISKVSYFCVNYVFQFTAFKYKEFPFISTRICRNKPSVN